MAGLAGIVAGLLAYWMAREAESRAPWAWAVAAWLVVGIVVLELTAP